MWRHEQPDPSAASGEAATTARGGRVRAALSAAREPIVVVLLLIAFFTTISGKPLDGLLMLLAAGGLAWDAGQRALTPADPDAGRRGGGPHHAGAASRASGGGAERSASPLWRRALVVFAAIAASAGYVVIVGSFSRYSWPATAAVVGLGAGVVILGWQGPARRRPDPGKLPLGGALAWGGVLVAGGLWELWALLHQPTLTGASYAHPTISVLTDPVLATAPGRAGVLAVWLAIGWYVVRR